MATYGIGRPSLGNVARVTADLERSPYIRADGSGFLEQGSRVSDSGGLMYSYSYIYQE